MGGATGSFDPTMMGVGALAGLALGSMSKTPQMPTPTVTPPPQDAQTPDAKTVLSQTAGTGQAGGAPGPDQTFLTGPGGVDPSALVLNKKTLLG